MIRIIFYGRASLIAACQDEEEVGIMITIMKIMIIIMINNHQWWLILINRERLHFVYILTLIMLANLRFAMLYTQLTTTITHVTLIMLANLTFFSWSRCFIQLIISLVLKDATITILFQRNHQSCLLPSFQRGHETMAGENFRKHPLTFNAWQW